MTVLFRSPKPSECTQLSQLCLRSKGYWGYDRTFLEKCRDELTIRPEDCVDAGVIVTEFDGKPSGIAKITLSDREADLQLLFVDPPYMGSGLGRRLFEWCADTARDMGARILMIEADPQAEAFYRRMGAVRIGECPSESIPDRVLPLMKLMLR